MRGRCRAGQGGEARRGRSRAAGDRRQCGSAGQGGEAGSEAKQVQGKAR